MPFEQKDLHEAIGQMMLAHWALQKQVEELQLENQQLKEISEPKEKSQSATI